MEGYRVEEGLMKELNESYSNVEDYPAQELYRLSPASAGQGSGGTSNSNFS